MRIIENQDKGTRHYDILESLFEGATSATLMSPFLAVDMKKLLAKFKLDNLKEINIITTLKPKTYEQFRKVDALDTLFELAQNIEEIKVRVWIDNRLHGKVYIFQKGNTHIGALVTSANLTVSGLEKNLEWGVLLDDSETISALHSSIANSTKRCEISREEVSKLVNIIDKYRSEHGDPEPQTEIDLDLTSNLHMEATMALDNSPFRVWLKPLGWQGDPVDDGLEFTSDYQEIAFARRPSGVQIGDTIIAYAVGSSKIISYFTAETEPRRITESNASDQGNSRWPWVIECRNESKDYGKQWWIHSLIIGQLMREYLSNGEDLTVTAVGGRTLGALNYGSDKLRLAPGFGRYLIGRVDAI